MHDRQPPSGAPSGRTTVLLHHRLPDGTAHYDWMILIPGSDPPSLATFRVAGRIDEAGIAAHGFRAERIADHRAAYLEYEGALSGGRGDVIRVAEGDVAIRRFPGLPPAGGRAGSSPEVFEAVGRLGSLRGEWRGVCRAGTEWDFRFTPASAGERGPR